MSKRVIQYITIILLTLPLFAQGRDSVTMSIHRDITFLDGFFDYVITGQNDTIYGKVRHNIYPFSRTISITTASGKQKFRYHDYKAYQLKGKKYRKARIYSAKGKELRSLCQVLVDGKLCLLRTNALEAPDYFLYYNGEFHMIMRRYFPNEVWQELMQCPAFAEKYKEHHREEGDKVIIYPRDERMWKDMVNDYNRLCGNLIE